MGLGNPAEQKRVERDFYEGPRHAEHILQVLNSYRKSGTFTDVVLQVEGGEFPCHRATLSASSLYFRSMFQGPFLESSQAVVHMQGITAVTMETLINFMYEGKAVLCEENVMTVYQAADLLNVDVLRRACVVFLEELLDYSNCLGILDFARCFSLTQLAGQCQTLLFRSFAEVCKHEEFLILAKDRVVELVELPVCREEVLLEAVLRWVQHDPRERKGALRELLELVHLPLVDPVFLLITVEDNELVMDCRECRRLVLQARRFQVLGKEGDLARPRPRRVLGVAEMIVLIGGTNKNSFQRLSFTEKHNPHTKEWTPGASMPGYAKTEFATCELQNDIYISGGQLNSSDVWRYMSQLDHWLRVAPLAQGRRLHAMAPLLGKLYVVGGISGMGMGPLSGVEVYSSYDNQWKEVAPLPLPVSGAAAAGCGGKVYVIGGAVSNGCNTSEVQCYDPEEDSWVFVACCPFSQTGLSAAVLDSAIYVAGGQMDKIYSYTPKTNTWRAVSDVSMKLEGCGLTVCEGKVYILGGRGERAAASPSIWSFCPASGELMEDLAMPRSTSYLGCATVTQRMPQSGLC
ncbi:kelch-like protein 24a [Osmerus mordax]|uniref:kelch-like protein 24a n=1 Tax=Osmerus mordax TaxID=8014 RepID=UPI00350F1BE9